MAETSLPSSRSDTGQLMRSGSEYFAPLHPPFSAGETGSRGGQAGETINYFVQDSKGVTVIEYCLNRPFAEAVAAALNGPLPKCPMCGAVGSMEHIKTEAHGIETHYDECTICHHRTDPE